MNNSNQYHTAFFKMPDTSHYLMGLKVHAYNVFICDWIGNVFDFNIPGSLLLKGPFVSLGFLYSLSVIYETDEKQNISDVSDANDNCVDGSNQDGEQYSGMLLAGESDVSE